MERGKSSRVINTVFMLLGITTMLVTLYDRLYRRNRHQEQAGR